MSDQPTNQISLRRFRDTIADIRSPVVVSRREPDGNMRLLGEWRPFEAQAPTEPVTGELLEIPVPEPRIIRSPEEVVAVVGVNPVRAVPKPSQRKKR